MNSLSYGKIEVKSINTSFCKASSDSGIRLNSPTSLGNITYSSICNTTANYSILGFHFCNVLNNEHKESSYGTFYAGYSTVLIENCSFLGNAGPGGEFDQYVSGITVKDPFCDRKNKTHGAVTTNNVQNIYSIHHLSHFSSYICEADYPILEIKKNIITSDEIIYHYSYHFISSLCMFLLNS